MMPDCNECERLRDIAREAADRATELQKEVLRLRKALDWYSSRAADIVRYLGKKQTDAVMAVMREFEVDNGARAQSVLPYRPKDGDQE